MTTPIKNRDLTKEAPHSPRARYGGFAILARTTDKCRATVNGKAGDYHFDCPLDKQLFTFKGVNGDQFKKAVSSAKTYEDVVTWLQSNGTPKTPEEIKDWSEKAEAIKVKDVAASKSPKDKNELMESVRNAGLDEDATLFEWLEADDHVSFESHAAVAGR